MTDSIAVATEAPRATVAMIMSLRPRWRNRAPFIIRKNIYSALLENLYRTFEGGLGDGKFALSHRVLQWDGVTSALEPDGRNVHCYFAKLANDMPIFFVVAGGAANVAGIQAYAVGAAGLLDDDEAYLGAILGRVLEAVQVSVVNLL